MKSSLATVIVALAYLFAVLLPASAAQPFYARAFQQAQAAGKTTFIHVGASWCSTCKRQKPLLQQPEQELPDLVVYEVDFDTAKDVLKRLGVRYQTTLIVFRGAQEVARSVGETSASSIRALVATGL